MAQFVALIEWQVQTNWFELDARIRLDYTRQLGDIIARYPTVRFRWFDAEPWTGKFTDFSLCEFDDLDSYNSLWGDLRRHPFLVQPYAFVGRVVMGMEIERPAPLPAPEPEKPTSASCPTCGANVRLKAKFCGSCGTSIPGGAV